MALSRTKRILFAGLTTIVAGLGSTPIATAQDISRLKDTDTLPLDPQVKHGRLPNGFQYFIRKSPNPKGKAIFRLVVNAGHLHEDPDQTGLAHLLEHMAFNGTKHYPHNAIREYFDKSGLQPGNDWNASTGIQTIYKLNLPVDKPELYANGFQIMRDWAQDLTLDSADIDAERGVVLGESRGAEDVTFKLQWRMEAQLLEDPKYHADYHAKHDENIRTFKYPAMVRFFNDWYRPDLEALVVVGDIDVAAAEATIVKLFSDLKMPASPRPQIDVTTRYQTKLSGKDRFLVMSHEEVPRVTVRAFLLRRSVTTTPRTVGDYRREIQDKLFNSMVRERLTQLSNRYGVPYENLYASVDRQTVRSTAGLDAMTFYLSLKPKQTLEPALEVAFTEWERLRRHGFTAGEFSRAKLKVVKELDQSNDYTSGDIAYRFISRFAEGAAAPDSATEQALRARLLAETKVEDLNALAREWLGQTRDRVIAIAAPTKTLKTLPTEKAVMKMWDEARNAKVSRYVEPKPVPENLMSEAEVARLPSSVKYTVTEIENLAVTKVELENGTTVLLKKAKGAGWRGDQLILAGVRAGGTNTYAGEDAEVAKTASDVVRYSGLGTMSRFELEAFTQANDISGGPYLGPESASINGMGKPENFEKILQLIYRYLTTTPRRDSAAFLDWKATRLEEIERSETDPSRRFDRMVDSIQYGKMNFGQITRRQVELANLDRSSEIYREQFLQPGGFTFILSGDFDQAKALPLLVKYLGALPDARPNRTVVSQEPVVKPTMGEGGGTIYEGTDERAQIRLVFSGEFKQTPLNDLKLTVLGHAFQILMNNRLREKEGGTYSAGAGVSRGYRAPGFYAFSVGFDAAPDNAEHMIDAARDEVAKVAREGLDSATYQAALARANEGLARDQDGQFWAGYLGERVKKGGDWEEVLKRHTLLNGILTYEAINAAAKQYFNLKNFLRFVKQPARMKPAQ